MVEQELQVVRLRDGFYRDGFYKVLVAFLIMTAAIVLLIVVSVSLFLIKPTPVQFVTDNEWRVVPPVPVNVPYLSTADLLQWVSQIIPGLFNNYNFVNYKETFNKQQQYFTSNGWDKFSEVMTDFVNQANVENTKLFVSANPTAAPIVLNQGILEGRYGWWVQMPLTITYASVDKTYPQEMQVQALVVRVPTLNNLDGVNIENIIVTRK